MTSNSRLNFKLSRFLLATAIPLGSLVSIRGRAENLETTPSTVMAVPPTESPKDAVIEKVRGRLSGTLNSTLQEVCGNHCPGYQIDVQFSHAVEDDMDHLGFSTSNEAVTAATPSAIKLISVNVLADENVSAKEKASLAKILNYKLSNLVTAPVAVKTVPIPKMADSLTSPPKAPVTWIDKLVQLQPLFWPLTVLALALLGLFALLAGFLWSSLSLKRVLKFFRPTPVEMPAPVALPTETRHQEFPQLRELLENRARDFEFLLERLAVAKDRTGLQNVLCFFSAAELTSKLDLQASALRFFSECEVGGSLKPTPEKLSWLERELDRSRWHWMAENKNPVLALSRLSPELRRDFFQRLNVYERAVVLLQTPSTDWPEYLANLNSNDKVELGLRLDSLRRRDQAELASALREIGSKLQPYLQSQIETPQALVQDFALYLNESEIQRMMHELSWAESETPVPNINEAVLRMGEDALAELCLRMSFEDLADFLVELNSDARKRVLEAAPQDLRARLMQRMARHTGLKLEEARAMSVKASFHRGLKQLGMAGSR